MISVGGSKIRNEACGFNKNIKIGVVPFVVGFAEKGTYIIISDTYEEERFREQRVRCSEL